MVAVAVLALAAGLFCGYLNVRLLTVAGERLTDSGSSKAFVISSLLRVGAFAIVAVVFAAAGPWWTAVIYILALFLPLANHIRREFRARTNR